MFRYKGTILGIIFLLALASLFFITKLKLNFDFSQFFPDGDEDLAFFQEFSKDFEKDDNTLLISLSNKGKSIFDTSFMNKVHNVTLDLRGIENIKKTSSITATRYPIKTPFGMNLVDLVHRDDPISIKLDSSLLMKDERFVGSLISKNGKATNVLIKTNDNLGIDQSDKMMADLSLLLNKYGFDENNYAILGKVNFQSSLVYSQKIELLKSTAISAILVALIIFLIFGTWQSVMITVISISLSLLIFMGFLGAVGEELTMMAVLYPVLILIVGCSDIIYVTSSYIDKLKLNKDNITAIKEVLREVGLATLMTSATTAIGFATLVTSRLGVLRSFGLSAALGVMLTFVVVIFVTPILLTFFSKNQLHSSKGKFDLLNKLSMHAYYYSLNFPKRIGYISIITSIICLYGISKITTNYNILNNLPKGVKVTEDFIFFEKNYAGFRPLEFAIEVKSPYKANDFEVINELDKIERIVRSTGVINSVFSQATIFKSINKINNGNREDEYKLPTNKDTFAIYQALAKKMRGSEMNVLVNKEFSKTRINSMINVIGADCVYMIGGLVDKKIAVTIDTSIVNVRRTGTGLILDKNSIYVIENLFQGLLLSMAIIALALALMLRNTLMLFISLVPNILPLFFAGAILGFFNIPMEAGISIIFSVIFGIAVDDTIHFLSSFKLNLSKGLTKEEAIKNTFENTGRSMILTSVILFVGFMVMLFSNNPVSVLVGVLISFTLVTALICDLYLLPVLLRRFF